MRQELEFLSRKIEQNTADIKDYHRYETLLRNGGLSHAYIFSYLNQAGFDSWEDFLMARNRKQKDNDSDAAIVGGLIGLGLGLLLLGLFGGGKK